MHRRLFIIILSILTLVVACTPVSVEQPVPTETSVPTNPPPMAVTATPTLIIQPVLPTEWHSQLEVIQAGNWSRLQLLKVIPVEIPLNHSAVAISPDGKTMAMGSSSGAQIYFIDLPSFELSQKVTVNGVSNVNAYLNTLEYLPDGTLMANSDGPYMIYHMDADGNVLSAWDGISFALSADKRMMAHTDVEGIVLVEIANNTPLVALKDGGGLDFSFSSDGSKIAAEDVGVDYIRTAIWDIPTKTLLRTLDETAAPRFSPDGKFLAAIRYDYENDRTLLKIFSPDGTTEIMTLHVRGPDDLINRAPVWSMDGSVVAVQITNGSSTAWDATNWQPLETPALQGLVYSFSPDGRILITRTSDGGILLWGVLP